MSVFANIGLGMVGFLIGNLLFITVVRSLGAIYEAAKGPSEGRGKAGRIALATLLSSGPWLLLGMAFFAFHVHAEPWAIPVAIGAFVAIAFFTSLAIYMLILRKGKRENSA